jgi:N6-L-threonylcarbamoyladenine synthase
VNVLGIETSCDDTAAAIVRDGRHILSSVVSSQTALHRPYGGVVPEIASRSHVEALPSTIESAVRESGLDWSGIDAIAVTYGPGLATSLLVGFSTAKGLAMRLAKPLIAVNHLEAHLYSVFLGTNAPEIEKASPFLALIVSGGHTCLIQVEGLGQYKLLGQTIDDAAGEAFDKGANLLGLGYPGGPAIDKAARGGDPCFEQFPRGVQRRDKSRIGGLDPDLCFSFSGVKTALLYYLRKHPVAIGSPDFASVAASYQEAIVDSLVSRCSRAAGNGDSIVAGGGVALNSRLRAKLADLAADKNLRLLLAEPKLCADNAAMVAGLAGKGRGITGPEAMSLDVDSSLEIGLLTPQANAG